MRPRCTLLCAPRSWGTTTTTAGTISSSPTLWSWASSPSSCSSSSTPSPSGSSEPPQSPMLGTVQQWHWLSFVGMRFQLGVLNQCLMKLFQLRIVKFNDNRWCQCWATLGPRRDRREIRRSPKCSSSSSFCSLFATLQEWFSTFQRSG